MRIGRTILTAAIAMGAVSAAHVCIGQDVRDDGRGKFGEQYDLGKYAECKKKDPRSSRCEVFRLVRQESPETWPYHDKPPIRWPDPPKIPVYKAGMTAVEYWRALCKAEAGEFIYKTVENVEGFFLIRPRAKEPEIALGDRHVMEDPYGYIDGEHGALSGVPWLFVGPERTSKLSAAAYRYLETPILPNDVNLGRKRYFPPEVFQVPPSGKSFMRFSGYDRSDRQTMKIEYTNELRSMFALTWRGIRRPLDRETGVAGGELAVVNLKTGEILGLRRGFVLGQSRGTRVSWFSGNTCPEYSLMPGIGSLRGYNKDIDFSVWFVNKVLKPRVQYKD